MSQKCAGPGCFNDADPRWGGFCDGHGVTTEEERRALLEGWRERNETVRTLLADVREHLWDVGPPATGWGIIDRGRDGDRQKLLERINAALEGGR